MRRLALATLASLAVTAHANDNYLTPTSYDLSPVMMTETSGQVFIVDQIAKEGTTKIVMNSHLVFKYNRTGCHKYTIKAKLNAYEQIFRGNICPGKTEFNLRTESEETHAPGTYPINGTLTWSALGENPTRTATATLTVN